MIALVRASDVPMGGWLARSSSRDAYASIDDGKEMLTATFPVAESLGSDPEEARDS